MDAPRDARIYRRQPFLKRIADIPVDCAVNIQNEFAALDWDALQERISGPLVIGLNGLMVWAKLGYWLEDPYSDMPRILKDSQPILRAPGFVPGFSALFGSSIQYILVAISLLNTYWLLTSKKTYTLMDRDYYDPPSSNNARLVELDPEDKPWSEKLPGRLVYPLVAPFLSRSEPEAKHTVWELSVWNPSVLCLNLFCWFSPAQALVLAGTTMENLYMTLPIAAAISVQLSYLVHFFQGYVKDRQLVVAEAYREYDNKFVKPRVFVRKFDRSTTTGTDTSELYAEEGEEVFRFPKPRSSWRNPFKARARATSPLILRDGFGRTSRSSSLGSSSMSAEEVEYGENDGEEVEDEDEENVGEDEDEDEDEDEEGDYEYEGPAIPHPTNALEFDD
ncbi:hypothetical protein BGZ74_001052 [Mortierella antarctica]|nr:hypothetical protein BGZ74_001052 [Mortierella antarctica]